MSRYLVTGGAGFIGSHLCDALVSRGDHVVVIDNLSSGKTANLSSLKEGLDFFEGDITSGGLDQIDGPFDAVVHLAALISGYDSLNDPDLYVTSNVNGLLRVINYVAARSVPRLVFASSSTVYGNSDNAYLSEMDLPAPLSVYAATKLMGEHLLTMYGDMHGFSHCSLRFFNVYGPRQAQDHPYANVTCKFSWAAANNRPIDIYGDGEQSRDFVYVDDVVRSIILVMDNSPSNVYNIGTGHDLSINRLASTLEKISCRHFSINKKSEWPNDIRSIKADISKASSEIGYTPQFPIEEGLHRTVDYFRNR